MIGTDMSKQHEYLGDAREWLALCETRYKRADVTFIPLVIARRWLRALEREPLDMDEVLTIVRDAEMKQNDFDVAFHGFSNDLRGMQRVLAQELLQRRDEAP